MAKKKKKKKTKHKKRRKEPSLRILGNRCDRALSLYMRALTEKETGTECPICKINPIQCCFHFISRRRKILRWDERNVIGACHTCNFFERRFPDISRAWFIRRFGVDLYLELVDTAMQKHEPTKEYLVAKTEEYKRKLAKLKPDNITENLQSTP